VVLLTRAYVTQYQYWMPHECDHGRTEGSHSLIEPTTVSNFGS
jgi:hypothetical protein